MRIDDLKSILSASDTDLTDEELSAIKERGYLDLEQDILLPLLTKQANFWEQIVTPRYYLDVDGNACHDENKTALEEGEKYMIIPGYSPENHPIGYTSTITANTAMDIAAARDGLDMVMAIENAVKRDGYEERIAKWENLKSLLPDYKIDDDGALCEWSMSEYTENNNHRHLSHLYCAWPGYETQDDLDLMAAAEKAVENRNTYNTTDTSAGHGWMHKALVQARLKDGDGVVDSLLQMAQGSTYYTSLMTDHDNNRRNDTYCTDTAIGTVGAINEALVFSNTGVIEILPALPSDWTAGSIDGIMARTRAEVGELSWDMDAKTATVTIESNKDDNEIVLKCGQSWNSAVVDGQTVTGDISLTLDNGESKTVVFNLNEPQEATPTPASTNEPADEDGYSRITYTDNSKKTFATGHWKDQPSINILNRTLSNDSSGKFYYAGGVGDYVGVELSGEDRIGKIGLYFGNQDALQRAAGCEVQAALSGEISYTEDRSYASGTNGNNVGSNITSVGEDVEWVTLFTMPDSAEELTEGWNYFEIADELRDNYMYVRYIRTAENTTSVGENNALDPVENEFYEYQEPETTPYATDEPTATPSYDSDYPYILSGVYEGETLTGIEVLSNGGAIESGDVIAASYNDEGVLSDIQIFEYDPETSVYTLDRPKNINEGRTTMYMWDKSMVPLAEAATATGASEPTATPAGSPEATATIVPTKAPTIAPTTVPTAPPTGSPEPQGPTVVPNSYWGDNGDGTFTNPVLALDYSDPDVIRVGEDYYMVTSTFMDCPGTAVLHSNDLVNWETVGYAIENPEESIGDRYSADSMGWYGNGVYAPSIRYHDGTFYVYSPVYNNGGIYVSTATDPAGPWTTTCLKDKNGKDIKIERLTDLCPLWDDENNCAYLLLSNLGSSGQGIDYVTDEGCQTGNAAQLFKMSLDGTTLLDADATDAATFVRSGVLIRNIAGTEGNKLYIKDGYYYIFNCDFQGRSANGQGPYVRRARNIYGDNPDGTAFDYVAAEAEENLGYYHGGEYEEYFLGSDAILQGAFVDTSDGDWYFMGQKGDYTAGGRMPWLVEVNWPEGEFPSMTVSDVVDKPIESSAAKFTVGSDDFDGEELSINWNWNHQPKEEYYELADGRLRMWAQTRSGDFWSNKNVMMQKYVDTEYVEVNTKLNLSGMADGQEAGLCHFNGGDTYITLGVEQYDGIRYMRYNYNGNDARSEEELVGDTLYLKTIVDSDKTAYMYYSSDGENWVLAGSGAVPTAGSRYWRGDRIGLYTYNSMQNAGYVDFDYYNYDFTSPVWDKEIPSLPEAEEMSVYREDYPYMETLEFENAASGTYDADGKTYVNFTSQATVSANANAEGGFMVDNVRHGDVIYLGNFYGSELEKIIVRAGTRQSNAKIAFYAADPDEVEAAGVSAETIAQFAADENLIGESNTLRYSSDNWNNYMDNSVNISGGLSGEIALFAKMTSSGGNFVGNFDCITLCYNDLPFETRSDRVEFEEILNTAWTSNPASTDTVDGAGVIGETKNGDVFDLGARSLDNLVRIDINAAMTNATPIMGIYRIDASVDVTGLSRSQIQSMLTDENKIADITIDKTTSWNDYKVNSAFVSLGSVAGEYRIVAMISASSNWGGNYDYIDFVYQD